ncbi:MAG: CinA family protein, partial [Oscillibacter sp.]|nr:CinA family protein [Oscillibacter sp.]
RVSAALTAVPGASGVFRGGLVTYQTPMKAALLGVPQEILDRCGAVSEECARAMAQGARRVTGAEVAVSVTGVAGPERDERGNEVGLVFVAADAPSGTVCRRLTLGSAAREEIQNRAAEAALALVCEVAEAL